MTQRLPALMFRFFVVGGVCAGLFFAIHSLLFSVARLPLWLSLLATYALCFGIGYSLQKVLTFRSSVPHRRSLPRYFALHVGGMVLVYLGTLYLAPQFPDQPLVPSLVTTVLAGVASFAISLGWVFKPVEQGRRDLAGENELTSR